jgi:GNAT superfamily N-acetyltransferase
LKILPLAAHHNRSAFDCGKAELNEFLRFRASQYVRQDVGRTYVAVATVEDPHVLGYYTVAVSAVPFENIPANLPRHPVPVLHLGRLATGVSAQGQGIGKSLLFHALRLAIQISDLAGIYAVEVVALDDEAQQFYAKYDFSALPPTPPGERVHLYLPLKKIRKLGL